MKPERLLPLILVIVVAAFSFHTYSKKTETVSVPEAFIGNRAVELFYKNDCITCHTVTMLPTARGHLGPGLDDIGLRAKEYDPEHNGEEYIRESILQPSKVVRNGFVNAMPSFEGKLTSDEVNVLVQWLMSLKSDGKST